MASNALLMSIVVKSVLSAGLFELMPSKTCCVRLVSKVFVECNGRKRCCVGAKGTLGWIMFSIRRSVFLDSVQSSVIGLYSIGRRCCKVFIWFKYCDDSASFPDARD